MVKDPNAYLVKHLNGRPPDGQAPPGYRFLRVVEPQALPAIWTNLMKRTYQGDNALDSVNFRDRYGVDQELHRRSFVVMMKGSKPIGISSLWSIDGDLFVHWTAVLAGHRGKGVGTAIIRRLMRLTWLRGHTRLYCKPKERRMGMIRLLENLGFKRTLHLRTKVALFISFFDQRFELETFCLPSVHRQTRPFDEVWLCVDDSEQHIVRSPGVRVRRSAKKFDGVYSAGDCIQEAMSKSKADIFVQTDADCLRGPLVCEVYLKLFLKDTIR